MCVCVCVRGRGGTKWEEVLLGLFGSNGRLLCCHPLPLILQQFKENQPSVTLGSSALGSVRLLVGHTGIYGVFIHIRPRCQNTDLLLGEGKMTNLETILVSCSSQDTLWECRDSNQRLQ